jgi:hypothetical protein
LDEICSKSLIERILDVSQRRSHEIRQALGTRDIGIGSAAGYHEIVQRSPGRWDVPISLDEFGVNDHDMPWWPVVADALGEDAEHSFSGVVSSEPGSPAQYWHTDSPHEAREHLPVHAINVLVALSDIPLAMGPTECARGSHVLTNHLNNPDLVVDEMVYQHATTSPEMLVKDTGQPVPEGCASDLKAGSALIFDDRILHRGLGNQAEDTRHVAYFSYARQGYSTSTYFEAVRSVFDAAS